MTRDGIQRGAAYGFFGTVRLVETASNAPFPVASRGMVEAALIGLPVWTTKAPSSKSSRLKDCVIVTRFCVGISPTTIEGESLSNPAAGDWIAVCSRYDINPALQTPTIEFPSTLQL